MSVTVAAGCAAVAIAGCGTAHAPSGSPASASSPSGASVKSASERIPDAAKVLTISATAGTMAGAKVPAPVTITNVATIRRIAALVDGRPLFPRGLFSCPADLGRAVQMTFRAAADGTPLAVVTADLAGCQSVRFVADGKPQPTLAGGAALARQVLAVTGLRWTAYGGGTPRPGGAINPGGVMQRG